MKDGPRMTRLTMARAECGITQRELAERSGVSRRMIEFYEQRERDINKAAAITVYKLAQAMGRRVEELLELE